MFIDEVTIVKKYIDELKTENNRLKLEIFKRDRSNRLAYNEAIATENKDLKITQLMHEVTRLHNEVLMYKTLLSKKEEERMDEKEKN